MRRGDGCVGRRRRVYSLVAAQAPRLLVDGRAGASRGVVEDGLWIFHAIRVRREVEDERHLAAGRRGTGWVGEVCRGWSVLVDFRLTKKASEVGPGRADAYLGHLRSPRQRDPRAVVVGAAVLVIPLGVVRTRFGVVEAPRRLALAQVGGVGRRSEQAECYNLCGQRESADDATARAETTRLRESHSHAVEQASRRWRAGPHQSWSERRGNVI